VKIDVTDAFFFVVRKTVKLEITFFWRCDTTLGGCENVRSWQPLGKCAGKRDHVDAGVFRLGCSLWYLNVQIALVVSANLPCAKGCGEN